jgi:hypothetical protein
MHQFQSKRGGRRVGSGRPKGIGRYGDLTVTVRVPKFFFFAAGVSNHCPIKL